jgi:hypothetical protein
VMVVKQGLGVAVAGMGSKNAMREKTGTGV